MWFFDVAAAVRAHRDRRTRTMPLVALTAYAGGGDRERAIAAGFTVHATKPISPAALTALVGALTQRTSPA
jgi:CheY-like chemotaxis protein